MFIVTNRVGDYFTILDTDDMVEENYEKSDLILILESGIIVYGASAFSLKNNTELTVVLRLYGEDNIAMDFDGFLMREIPSNQDEFYYQVIDSITESSALTSNTEFLTKLYFKYLRSYNKNLYDLSVLSNQCNLNAGYRVFSYSDDSVIIKDLSNGATYSCDFFTMLYIYLVENLRIDGVDDIDFDRACLYGKTYRSVDVLKKYGSLIGSIDITAKTASVSDYSRHIVLDEFETSWGSLDYLIPMGSVMFDSNNVPLYNIKSSIIEADVDLEDSYVGRSLRVVDFGGGKATLDDGGVVDFNRDTYRAFSVCGAFDFANTDLMQDFKSWCDVYVTKCKTLNRSTKFLDEMNAGISLLGCSETKLHNYNHTQKSKFPNLIRTAFGNIEVYGTLTHGYKYLWLTRMTRLGSLGFSFYNNCVVADSMKALNPCMSNESFGEAIERCKAEGISYCNNSICPVCVSNIKVTEYGVVIKIACLVSCCSDGSWKTDNVYTAFNMIELPILCLGSKLKYCGNVYVLDMLASRLVLEESVVNKLVSSYDCSDIYNLWGINNLTKAKFLDLSKFSFKRTLRIFDELHKKFFQ